MTLFTSDCIGSERNCLYPHPAEIRDEASFRRAVSRDYVAVAYRDNYRKKENFLSSNCLAMDCDNDHSDRPEDWATPEKVQSFFKGVSLAFHFSRNHMKQKGSQSPRPRFHCFFAIRPTESAEDYAALKRRAAELFPFFDEKALDAARFFYGTSEPQVLLCPGPLTLNQWLEQRQADQPAPAVSLAEAAGKIPQGRRNTTLSRYAAKVLLRLGNTERAARLFKNRAKDCDPPLDPAELDTVWRSAVSFWQRISASPDYVPPEEYEKQHRDYLYKPTDKSDVAEARVLADAFSAHLRFSTATDFLTYNGKIWETNPPKAHALMHNLSDMQLREAEDAIERVKDQCDEAGVTALLEQYGGNALMHMTEEQKQLCYKDAEARDYKKIAMQYRQSRNIKAVLEEVKPMVQIRPEQLDGNPYLLNTPSGTYDLRKGLRGKQPHNPEDYLTRLTAVAPSKEGEALWQSALDTFFQGDQALKDYVQLVAGMIAVGEVRREEMIIAYGEGRNGKSTFWNVLAKVLGTYSGSISADILTKSCYRNVKPELAEIRGRRMLIASELEEGLRLNTAMVKQLCSTDRIKGEAKYCAPFDFDPSHTLVLYTNHLPKVGATDAGIWRRLIVIPFQAKIEGKADRKNFTKELLDQAGGAILSWMIEGAEKIIASQFHLLRPPCVEAAIGQYRSDNDWLAHFLDERCLLEPTLSEKSGELYTQYRKSCAETGEYTRSTTDFYAALAAEGFEKRKTSRGILVEGLHLKPWEKPAWQ